MKWLIALVAAAAIAWFSMQYMNKQAADEAATAAEAATLLAAEKAEAATQLATEKAEAAQEAASSAAEALIAAQNSMPAGIDLGKISGALDGVFSSASEALSGITDLESAKNAIPSLQDAASKLSGLNDVVTRLPEAAKGPLASIIQGGISLLQPLVDKVIAIPLVGALVEPVVTPIMEMLNGIAQ
ncbi:MAG: vacuolar-type H+-ATPase subunit E/Vma4 [Granulosicoccus sp.]|jgi:vacuolar-type H+-ATPase subunit E/Vma4